MKANVYALTVPGKQTRDFTFIDPNTPGWEAKLTLRKYGVMGASAFESRANEMHHKYTLGFGPYKDGKPDPMNKLYQPPTPLTGSGGELLELSYSTCKILAAVELAQVQDEDERYTFQELAAMTVSDSLAVQICECMEFVLPDEPKGLEVTENGPPDSKESETSLSTTE